MNISGDKAIQQAIETHSPAVLAAWINTRYCQIRVKLTSEASAEGGGIWAQVCDNDRLIDPILRHNLSLELLFQLPNAQVSADTEILRKGRAWWLNRAILLRWPQRVGIADMRHDVRELVPDEVELNGSLALGHGTSANAPSSGRLWDLSLGGASIIIAANPRFLHLTDGDPLTIALPAGNHNLAIRAVYRHKRRLGTDAVRIGVAFVDLAADIGVDPLSDYKALLADLEQRRIVTTFRSQLRRIGSTRRCA